MDDSKLFWYRAKCLRVIDGGIADFEFDLGFYRKTIERVQLDGYQAADVNSGSGKAEFNRLKNLILDQVCWVQTRVQQHELDGRRYLATIYVGEHDDVDCVNDLMAREFHPGVC
jgi:hypothetical protein